MITLLEKYFGPHYKSTKKVKVICNTMTGIFACRDLKACRDCKRVTHQTEANCNHVVFYCDAKDNKVDLIELENFLNNFKGLQALPSDQKCDLLLVGKDKIVFCDMTCSNSKYITPYVMKDGTEKIGKRNTVKGQLRNSITVLTNVPEIASEINLKNDRLALFAFREKPQIIKDDFDIGIISQMRKFNKINNYLNVEPMFSDIGNGFIFTEVKYPNTFLW